VYGQVGYSLGDLSEKLSGVSIDVGLRYTEDTNKVCTVPGQLAASTPLQPSQCPSATLNNPSSKSNKLTYTVGANWQATPDVFAYAVMRRGYRGGGVNSPTFGGTLTPFQGYRPETVDDVELGLKTNFNYEQIRGRFNIAAYSSKYTGLIAAISTASATNATGGADGDFNSANDPTGRNLYANVGDGKVQGIEVDLVVSPMEGLELDAGAAWIDKKITAVTLQLPSTIPAVYTKSALAAAAFVASPDFSYSFGASYSRPLPGDLGEVILDLRYFKISQVQVNSILIPKWDRVDFTASLRDVGGTGVDLQAFVNNVLDDQSAIAPALSSQGLGLNTALYQPPRMAGLRVRYAWGGERR
jgi:iron complex outermembrane receptor protein